MKLTRPKLPKGYRFLKDGKSKNKDNDLVWAIDEDLPKPEWVRVDDILIFSTSPLATGKTYYEPKTANTWNLFRCRKKK